MTAADIALLCAAGVAGGFVNAIAGGGSLLVFPAMVATGMGTLSANVTNSIALWPAYFGSMLGLGGVVREQLVHAKTLATTAFVGGALGCALLLTTPEAAFDVIVGFLVLLATALVAAQPWIKSKVRAPSGAHPKALVLGVGAAAVYGGYFGGGLGIILLAILGLGLAQSLAQTNALKVILSGLVATVGAVAFAVFGPVDWAVVAITAPAAIAGGIIGGRVSQRVDEKLLRRSIVVCGLTVGVWLTIRAVF